MSDAIYLLIPLAFILIMSLLIREPNDNTKTRNRRFNQKRNGIDT